MQLLLTMATSCAAAALLLPTSGCGPSAPASREPRLPDSSRLESAARREPVRVIPANTAAAEFLAALIGADRFAALPEQADDYSSFDFHSPGFSSVPRFPRYVAEPLLVLRPDLVVTHEWQEGETSGVLRAQKIPVLVLKSAQSYADIRDTLVQLGQALQVEAKSAAVIADLDRRVEILRAKAADRAGLRALEYTNGGNGGSTAGTNTTGDTMIRLAGLRNAAAEAGIDGHARLDFETLIGLDPDVIVVAAQARGEGGSATKAVLESTSALARLSAVKNARIIVLPAALMSSDSPSLIDAAEQLAAAVDRMLAPKKAASKKP